MIAELTEAARIARHFGSALAQDVTALIALLLFVGALGMWTADIASMIRQDAERQVAMGEAL
jgi:hypothetical protein